jgi:signal transduction histidine kinase
MDEQQQAEYSARLERDKLEALKELAYGASHEINNPLANIAARAQSLLEDETDPERRRKLISIHRQAMRAHEMIADLMLFARPPKLKLASCDVPQLVRRVVDEHAAVAAERDIVVECELAGGSCVLADDTQLAIAIAALLTNALEAIGADGRVRVAVRSLPDDPPRIVISVTDDGPGISDKVRAHMFDPFFSGREAGRGLGFGLSKCWRIVTEHGGQVAAHNSGRRGAEFSIILLQHRQAAA